MDFNFFQWIREGVKRSVLLGVSDAVNQMGMPHEEEAGKEGILSFLQEETAKATVNHRLSGNSGASTRKLGRSLTDIRTSSN